MKNILLSFSVLISLLFSCKKAKTFDRNDHSLPIIDLSIKEKYLWSADSGLFIIGSNGINGCDGMIANYNQKWEFPANITFTVDNKIEFNEDVGFKVKGNCTRSNSMKSIGIYWKKKWGNKNIEYPLFPASTVEKYKRLFLRNSGNDFGRTHIKDASITQIIKKSGNVDFQEYRPSVVYLNDEYWGIYNMREMITPNYFKYHYDGVDDDSVDLLEGSETNPRADDGTVSDYMIDIVSFINNNDLSQDVNYETIINRIEIDSYIDYIIIQTYIANKDWPIGNVKWWRDKTSENHAKWRWVVYDTDFSFRLKDLDVVWIGDLYGKPYDEGKEDGFFIFNNLIKNDKFRTKFLDRYQYFIDYIFEVHRVENIFSEVKKGIKDEYPNHQERWNTANERRWNNLIYDLIEFNDKRNDKMNKIIKSLR